MLLESAYYNSGDSNTPASIYDVFENGLPADFRLVGATTRSPEEISPALCSRCIEKYFRPLLPDEIAAIGREAIQKIGLKPTPEAVTVVQQSP